MSELLEKLEALSRTPVLLVACDYDGTLAPIVPEPGEAVPLRESVVALNALSAMAQTYVAIVSGRALADLASRTAGVPDLHLVGSHGSEFDPGFALRLPADVLDLWRRLAAEVTGIAKRYENALVEEKPAALAFHYRNVPEHLAATAVNEVLQGPGDQPGVFVRQGKKVVELSVVETNKGHALAKIRHQVGATGVLFMGDDSTDEDAFETLAGPDIGLKVGAGETRALFRVSDCAEVSQILAQIVELRAAWLAGANAPRIDHYAMLSDQRTVALVDPAGRVAWLCLPRVDSSALFGELLGGPTAGFFAITATDGANPIGQHYDGNSFVLQTRWPSFTVTDYLDASTGRPFHRAGRTDLVRVIEGAGRIAIRYAPRPDFGRVHTRIRPLAQGLSVEDTSDPIVLFAPDLTWQVVREGPHETAYCEALLGPQPLVLELRYGTGNLKPALTPEIERRRQTKAFWSGWTSTLKIPPLHAELIIRSALVLKALCYGPTGAIVAAGTTSLPEHLGGVRNWDYRFCWPRDAAMAAAALVRLGNTGHAHKFLDWLLQIVDQCESPDRLRPIYSVHGGHLAPEAAIDELAGYAGSRPVRIGNAAAQQVQLDVFGPIVDLLALLAERGAPVSGDHWRLARAMIEAVQRRWREPDHGIWEFRGPRRQHVHSKIMCWHAVNRAMAVEATMMDRQSDTWLELRENIAADILKNAWNDRVGAFTGAYGEDWLDAAVLQIGLTGLIEARDQRFVSTVEVIERTLRSGPTVHRYRCDDGLPGTEGGFHLCTSWLIESYLLLGRLAEAEELFEQLAGLAGPLGLLSEEWGTDRNTALGNYPQAYSHLGLINAAVRLARARLAAFD